MYFLSKVRSFSTLKVKKPSFDLFVLSPYSNSKLFFYFIQNTTLQAGLELETTSAGVLAKDFYTRHSFDLQFVIQLSISTYRITKYSEGIKKMARK